MRRGKGRLWDGEGQLRRDLPLLRCGRRPKLLWGGWARGNREAEEGVALALCRGARDGRRAELSTSRTPPRCAVARRRSAIRSVSPAKTRERVGFRSCVSACWRRRRRRLREKIIGHANGAIRA